MMTFDQKQELSDAEEVQGRENSSFFSTEPDQEDNSTESNSTGPEELSPSSLAQHSIEKKRTLDSLQDAIRKSLAGSSSDLQGSSTASTQRPTESKSTGPEELSPSSLAQHSIEKKRTLDSLQDAIRKGLASSSSDLQGSSTASTQRLVPPAVANVTAKRRRKKATNQPKRPMSAYNFFFRDERNKILKEGRFSSGYEHDEPSKSTTEDKPQGKPEESHVNRILSFADLAKLIGARWKETGPEERVPYERLAADDLIRYAAELKEYDKIRNGQHHLFPQGGTTGALPMTMMQNHFNDMTTFLPFRTNNPFSMNSTSALSNHNMWYHSNYQHHPQGYSNLQQGLHHLYGPGQNHQPQQSFLSPLLYQRMMGVPSSMNHSWYSMNTPTHSNVPNTTSTHPMPSYPLFSVQQQQQQYHEQPFETTSPATNMRQLQERLKYQTEVIDRNHGSNTNHRK